MTELPLGGENALNPNEKFVDSFEMIFENGLQNNVIKENFDKLVAAVWVLK